MITISQSSMLAASHILLKSACADLQKRKSLDNFAVIYLNEQRVSVVRFVYGNPEGRAQVMKQLCDDAIEHHARAVSIVATATTVFAPSGCNTIKSAVQALYEMEVNAIQPESLRQVVSVATIAPKLPPVILLQEYMIDSTPDGPVVIMGELMHNPEPEQLQLIELNFFERFQKGE